MYCKFVLRKPPNAKPFPLSVTLPNNTADIKRTDIENKNTFIF